MTAAEWIAKGRKFAGRSQEMRARYPRALDALEAVLAVVRPHRREPATDGSVDEHDYVGALADEIEAAIEAALRGES